MSGMDLGIWVILTCQCGVIDYQYHSLVQGIDEEAVSVVPGGVLEPSILPFSFCGILKVFQKVKQNLEPLDSSGLLLNVRHLSGSTLWALFRTLTAQC